MQLPWSYHFKSYTHPANEHLINLWLLLLGTAEQLQADE